ncbi:MAG: glutathione peroxidase [Flavihumibacter sp.]
MNEDFYALQAKTPGGQTISFDGFRGKLVLVVNTATRCGLAPQFEQLEALHQHYKEKGLVVLGFPCDQFAGQEPETNESMEQVCKLNHGVSFPLTAKCKVNGPDTDPVFKYLKKKLGGFLGSRIKWNFTKFLVYRVGVPYKRSAPTTTPQAIEKDILRLL